MTLFSRAQRPGTVEHSLKTHPKYFRAVDNGMKSFEVRKRDRAFKVGDTLRLREWQLHLGREAVGEFTGRELRARVTYILESHDVPDHLKRGYCVMGIKLLRPWYVSLSKRIRFELQSIRS